MEVIIVVGLIVINSFTVYKFLFNVIFGSKDAFNESVRYSFTPNIISLFRGEYWKDKVGSLNWEFSHALYYGNCHRIWGY